MEKKIFGFHDIFSLITKTCVFIGAIIGIVVTSGAGGFMGGTTFLYFTIQSNMWIGAICLVYLVFDVLRLSGKEIVIPQWLNIIKFMFTVAISLTFLVFSVMLTPNMIAAGQGAYLASASNIFCHNFVPIFAIIDLLLYDYGFKSKGWKSVGFGIIMPIYYLIFALICSFSGVNFGDGAKVPYFFLDYEANGWFSLGGGKFGVVYWIIILVGVVLGICWALLKGQEAVQKKLSIKKLNPQLEAEEINVEQVSEEEIKATGTKNE